MTNSTKCEHCFHSEVCGMKENQNTECPHFADVNKTFLSPYALGDSVYWIKEPDLYDDCKDPMALTVAKEENAIQRLMISKDKILPIDEGSGEPMNPGDMYSLLTEEDAYQWIKEHMPEKLPCNAGDKLYRLTSSGNIQEEKCKCITLMGDEVCIKSDEGNIYHLDDFGKTVFTDYQDVQKNDKTNCQKVFIVFSGCPSDYCPVAICSTEEKAKEIMAKVHIKGSDEHIEEFVMDDYIEGGCTNNK